MARRQASEAGAAFLVVHRDRPGLGEPAPRRGSRVLEGKIC